MEILDSLTEYREMQIWKSDDSPRNSLLDSCLRIYDCVQVRELANRTGMDFSLQLSELQEKYDEVGVAINI